MEEINDIKPDPHLAECLDFLQIQKLEDCQYTTGLFYRGITIYKQQIRALNLFYAMKQCGLFENGNTRICVIGGGVSGLTFAAAAIKANFKVTILEKEPILLSMQYGCDIRTVHPNIYDWPSEGATFPHARLPLLSWISGSASNVAKQIYHSFRSISSDTDTEVYRNVHNIKVYRDKKNNFFKISANESVDGKLFKPLPEITANYIIYATGFGIEKACLNNSNMPSYWRNEGLSQLFHSYKKDVYLSGTGDGLLIDLFRSKIVGFSYERFLKYIDEKISGENKNVLNDNLLKIKKEWLDHKSKNEWPDNKSKHEWLYDQIKSIDKNILELLRDYFQNRSRGQVRVKVIISCSFKELFNLDRISFINAFILFFIEEVFSDTVKFLIGKTQGSKEYSFKPKSGGQSTPFPDKAFCLLRHGTNALTAFSFTQFRKSPKLDDLKARQDNARNPDRQLWDEQSLMNLFEGKDMMGFYTQDTISVCSGFISILNSIIASTCSSVEHYRLALFRANNASSSFSYQQMTKYFGTLPSEGKTVGKLFSYTKGNIGLSMMTGEPLYLKSESDRDKVIELLDIRNPKSVLLHKSFLSIPILGMIDEEPSVNLILYMDADTNDFFEREDRIKLIVSATKGWIEYIDHGIENDFIRMGSIIGTPLKLKSKSEINNQAKERLNLLKDTHCHRDIIDVTELDLIDNPLKFKNFHSFDIFHQNY